jgi:hypothetical protein
LNKSVTPNVSGNAGAISATRAGPNVHPMKKKLSTIVDGKFKMMPAMAGETRSAASDNSAMKAPPATNETTNCAASACVM